MTDAQVLRKASRIERIMFAARLLVKAAEELRRLVADENGNDPDTWHGLLRQDLEQMALIMQKELGAMPPYSCQPEEWHKLWADFPGAWKLLVTRFDQRLQESQDADIADDGQLAHVPSDLDGVHTCTDCGKQFASNCGLAVHKAKLHLTREVMAFAHRVNVASIPGCDLCTTCLTRGPQCLEWCMLHREPLTDQDREVLDREDADQRRKDKREGRSFLATAMPFVLGS